tara:strand:- start:29983 stop:30609 length:627 start_codon:yes stop_codon:yes gene_type:complete
MEKITKVLQILTIFLLLSFTTAALEDTEKDYESDYEPVDIVETAAEKKERMLEAFDNSEIVQGQMTFSFTSTTTKEEAIKILKKYDLELQQYEVCSGAQDPDGKATDLGCETEDSWNDMIQIATVTVPKGKEKDLAEEIVDKETNVEWAEPEFVMTTDDGAVAVPGVLEPLESGEPGNYESNVEDTDIDTGWLEGISTGILDWFKSWF